MEIKNEFEFIQEVNKLEFRFATTYAKSSPHEYHYASTKENVERVRALNKYIQENGEKEMFYTTEFDVIFIDNHKYWSMDNWAITKILNRNWDFKKEDGSVDKSITEGKKEQ